MAKALLGDNNSAVLMATSVRGFHGQSCNDGRFNRAAKVRGRDFRVDIGRVLSHFPRGKQAKEKGFVSSSLRGIRTDRIFMLSLRKRITCRYRC